MAVILVGQGVYQMKFPIVGPILLHWCLNAWQTLGRVNSRAIPSRFCSNWINGFRGEEFLKMWTRAWTMNIMTAIAHFLPQIFILNGISRIKILFYLLLFKWKSLCFMCFYKCSKHTLCLSDLLNIEIF